MHIIIWSFIKFFQNLRKQSCCHCFGPKYLQKMTHIPLKNVPENLCLLMVPHNHTQKVSNQMKWFIFLVMSSRMDRHSSDPSPPHRCPSPLPLPATHFKGKWILISSLGGGKGRISTIKKRCGGMVLGQVYLKEGGCFTFSR